jgi:iron complex transport system permease protein
MSTLLAHRAGQPHAVAAPDRRWRRWLLAVPALLLLCLCLIGLSVAIGVGSVTLTPGQFWQALWAPEQASRLTLVATNARLTRALMACGVGAALGIAGALLQALYRNPLADPGITGVTQGATTAVVAWTVFGPEVQPGSVSWVLPAVAAIGAVVAASATWAVARLAGRVDPIRLILIGVLVGGVLNALSSLAMLWAGDNAQVLLAWLSGSLATASWEKVQLFAVAAAVALPLLLVALPRTNVLQFGDEIAAGLGQAPMPARACTLLAACLLTAAAVCTVGGIGFVGLIAPHMLRRLVGSDLRRLVPTAALAGGALVLAADFAARNLRPADLQAWLGIPLAPITLPVGVYLALLGGPFFLMLLRRTRA